VIELYVFFEMTAAATRIEMIDFVGTRPYTSEGQIVQRSERMQVMQSRLSRSVDRTSGRMPSTNGVDSNGATLSAHEPDATRVSRFDVRDARCAVRADEDALRSAIESCGAGIDAFNSWMHDMLVACSADAMRRIPSPHAPRRQRRSAVVAPVPHQWDSCQMGPSPGPI
jgi:hypothetical protein